MTQYQPYADVMDNYGIETTLSTYDSFDDVEGCIKQFDLWEQEYAYEITDARVEKWVDGTFCKVVHFEKAWRPKYEGNGTEVGGTTGCKSADP